MRYINDMRCLSADGDCKESTRFTAKGAYVDFRFAAPRSTASSRKQKILHVKTLKKLKTREDPLLY